MRVERRKAIPIRLRGAMQFILLGLLLAFSLVEQDRCAHEAGIIVGMQIQMFEIVFEYMVRPVPYGWALLAVKGFSDPYSSDYLVIITKNFANLPFFLLKTDPLGTEHLPFLREGIASFL